MTLLGGPAAAADGEWISCVGGAYAFDILVRPAGARIDEVAITIDGLLQDRHQWEISARDLDLRAKTLRFIARARAAGQKNLALRVEDGNGQLRVTGERYDAGLTLHCHWGTDHP